jgi:hypothetical protein
MTQIQLTYFFAVLMFHGLWRDMKQGRRSEGAVNIEVYWSIRNW